MSEEIDWKKKYEEKQQAYLELEAEFKQFETESKELEHELEKEIDAVEDNYKKLQIESEKNSRSMKEQIQRYEQMNSESIKRAEEFEKQLEKLKQENTQMKKHIFELETENDHLERKEREFTATFEEMTEQINKFTEETLWLQTELEDERTTNQEKIQRMKDELKEVELELSINKEKRRNNPLTASFTKDDTNKSPSKPNYGGLLNDSVEQRSISSTRTNSSQNADSQNKDEDLPPKDPSAVEKLSRPSSSSSPPAYQPLPIQNLFSEENGSPTSNGVDFDPIAFRNSRSRKSFDRIASETSRSSPSRNRRPKSNTTSTISQDSSSRMQTYVSIVSEILHSVKEMEEKFKAPTPNYI